MNDKDAEQTPVWIIFNATLFWLRVALLLTGVAFVGMAIGDTLARVWGWK